MDDKDLIRKLSEEIEGLQVRNRYLEELIGRPEIKVFLDGVKTEAAHQRNRWGRKHDELKTPEDWLWVLGFLATKATQAKRYGDEDKYRHHIVTAGALCANWFEFALKG